MQASDHPFLRVRDPPDLASCISVEGSSHRRIDPIKGDSTLVREDFFAAMVITMIMRVLVEELLCQDSRG
jgi:hypothetical protein